MSGCAECRELMSAYLDREATPDEAARMRAHLATCAECRATMEAYRRIGTTVRSMPTVLPPFDLTASIYAQTIDTEPRRLFLITGRMRYPLAAAAAGLLIFLVAGYMLFGGYQRSIQPAIADYEPDQNQQWQTQNPIRITFNKAMDRESVESALAIQPPGENERLDHIWDGNTLLIGGRPLRPGSEYTIKITTDARDEWGNRLDQNFELSFTTVESVAFETPTAIVPTATSTAPPDDPTPTASIAPSPTSTSAAIVGTAPPSPTETPVVAPATPPTPSPDTSGVGGGDGGGTFVPPTPDRAAPVTPTSESEPLQPTMTPIPSPTPSPTPTVSPPTATVMPPTATPMPPTATTTPSPVTTATLEPEVPTPSPTTGTIAVAEAFADVYWSNQSVQSRLGEPVDAADSTSGQALGFQNGTMLYRSDFDSIYVLVSGSSSWERRDNPGAPYPNSVQVTEGTWAPGGVFGALWQSELYYQETLGFAVSESESTFIASVQTFENGTMFSAPGVVYIFYSDGTGAWEFWPASE